MKYIILILFCISFISCNDEENIPETGLLQLSSLRLGSVTLTSEQVTENIPVDKGLVATFNLPLDTTTTTQHLKLEDDENNVIPLSFAYLDNYRSVSAIPNAELENNKVYKVLISNIEAVSGEVFPGAEFAFRTEAGEFEIVSASIDNKDLLTSQRITNVAADFTVKIAFSEALDPSTDFSQYIRVNNLPLTYDLSQENKRLEITLSNAADHLSRYFVNISSNLNSASGAKFNGFVKDFYTALDSTYKFPEVTEEALLTKVQEQTFKYFWDFAHPTSGLIRERNTSGDLVTIGGSGFGVMAILVGIERGFITRQEGVSRLETIVNFLKTADRFHGVWPHWMNGVTGGVIPFSPTDNGGDLVETAFMIQGLLTVREYLNPSNLQEQSIIADITQLWEEVEWDWYTRDNQNVLYWHWSPNFGWEMNLPIRGWNESLIVYVLAASSPTHSISAEVYHQGWARNGGIVNGNEFYGINLPVGYDYGGPLFFSHYSFLGLDPRNLEDQYANYWDQNVSHSQINQQHAVVNPNNFVGYGKNAWGFTASDNHEGYNAHSPTNDLGVITPTASLSSMPYTPELSINALNHFYYLMGDKLWGEYGFVDAYNPTRGWYANSYLAIDQGPIVLMIENYRSALLWDLFMQSSEIQQGLTDLGFTSF